jgi:tetratricopeptide (TPR) repeat protein
MRVSRTIWANLALSLSAPAVFFLLCELVLYLSGVRPLALTEDPYVGYASSQPLFQEQTGPDGKPLMVTNPVKLTHFNSQSFPRAKAPGTYRIFSLGGSTTYGHPWRDPVSFSGWLRALLPKADGARKWEVINAGGISYASYREAMLVAELIQYQPDLFIIYSGHNEFLEERTYRKTAGIPRFVRELSGMLDHTRTYSALRMMARKFQAEKPEAATGSGSDKLAGEVDDILAKTIGPTSYTRDDVLRRNVLDHYHLSLERIAELAHSAGAQVIFLTTPGNEKDCSPFKSEPKAGLSPEASAKIAAWVQAANSLTDKPAEASALYDSALALDDRNAGILYAAGKAAYSQAKYPEAKRLFQKALDEDICPLRALTPMRSIVLETARKEKAQSIDFTRLLEEKTVKESGNDILGEPDFVDHVHLSIDDYRFIALAILDKMEAMGAMKKAPGFGDSTVKEVTAVIMAKMGPHELGEGLHNLAKVVNWAGKHEDAARIAERALATDSQGLEAIWSSLFVGAARERQGKEDEAIPHYRRAVRLDTNNPQSRHYLAAALMRQGSDREAAAEFSKVLSLDPGDAEAQRDLGLLEIRLGKGADAVGPLMASANANPNKADIRYLLGEALLAAGRIPEAERSFRAALQIDPREARAIMGLAKIAQAQGNIPEAINLYAKALSIAPQLEEARAALSHALGSFNPPR